MEVYMKDFSKPLRSEKPRKRGITHVLDKGLGPHAVEDLIETAKDYIDILKLGWGTGLVTGNLEKKIELYHHAGISVCLGGTFFEYAYIKNRLDDYEAWVRDLNIKTVEISNGTIDMDIKEKLNLIERFSRNFTILSEVGSKDTNVVVAPYKWVEEIKATIKAGVFKIITEGRESGTVGVFRKSGEIREGLIEEIMQDLDYTNFIFEAPNKPQQVWFIKKFGPEVNLGNIASSEVISLETLRLGLRGDTFLTFHGQSQNDMKAYAGK